MEYSKNFERYRQTIETIMTQRGVHEVPIRMNENNIITGEEMIQMNSLSTTNCVKQILKVVNEKYCYMKFIGILYTCGLKECAQLIEGNAVLSIHEGKEQINAQMESDLQKANHNIKQLQHNNDRLQREKEILTFRIREQSNSLGFMLRNDKMYAEKCEELKETRKELKLIEQKIAKINSRDLVRENTLLQEDIAASQAQVQSLEEKTDVMLEQNFRMEQKVDVLSNKIDKLCNVLSGQERSPSNFPIQLESERTIVCSGTPTRLGSEMLVSEPTLVKSERSSKYVPRTGTSAAQVVKLPPIKK